MKNRERELYNQLSDVILKYYDRLTDPTDDISEVSKNFSRECIDVLNTLRFEGFIDVDKYDYDDCGC
jgi:hypothetical protein